MDKKLHPIARFQLQMIPKAFGIVAWPLLVMADSTRQAPYIFINVIHMTPRGDTVKRRSKLGRNAVVGSRPRSRHAIAPQQLPSPILLAL